MKILVCRFSSIGDVVLTTPILRALQHQLPSAKVHFITKRPYAQIIANLNYCEKVWSINREITEVLSQLRTEDYTHLIDLHNNLRSRRMSWQLGIKTSRFPKLNFEKWILVNLKVNVMPQMHVVERYFKACAPLGVNADGKGLAFQIPELEQSAARLKIKDLPEQFVAYAFGGKHKGKLLPNQMAIELCNKIKLAVVLLGGPEDAERGDAIAKSSSQLVFNMAGKLSLNESAYVLKCATAVLAHDTGLMHIASAFNKPIISLWGGTTPALGMWPYQAAPASKMIVTKNRLSPSSKLGNPTLLNPDPMSGISIDEAANAVNQAIDTQP